MDKQEKKSLSELHKQHRDDNWALTNWRAWGSWFSWGSPVGLGIFYALVMLSTAAFIWIVRQQ